MKIMMLHGRRYLNLILALFVLLQSMRTTLVFSLDDIKCIQTERQALLTLKQGIIDDYGYLSSWDAAEEQSDCCKWSRIKCNNRTGHVVMLDLQSTLGKPLKGQISPSLFELRHLNYLDISGTSFDLSDDVPELIGSLSELRHLNLARAGLVGTFHYKLGNLSNLHFLDLSLNAGLTIDSFQWLSRLSFLKYLDISNIVLKNAVNWLREINMLPSLANLKLAGCFLRDPVPPLPSYINFSSSLTTLDLSFSFLSSTSIITWLSNITGLVDLNLARNSLQGPIPDTFWNMTSLKNLDLSGNKLEGGIPKSMRNLCNLQRLDLSVNRLKFQIGDMSHNLFASCSADTLEVLSLRLNQISGPLPEFTKFSSLRELYLDKNQIDGPIPKSFGDLPKLLILDLQENQLTGSLPDLTKSLKVLMLSFNQLTGTLTKTMEQLSDLVYLYVSSNHFEGVIAESHLLNLSKLQHMDLSLNNLILNLTFGWVPPFKLVTLRLSSCKLGPGFPKWLQNQKNLNHLDISNNGISESIPNWLWELSPNLRYLNLSHNQLHGMLPNTSVNFVNILDLSYNHFGGPLPLFSSNARSLDLSNNMFSSGLSSLCRGGYLSHLDLSDNLLSGGIPDCWKGKILLSVFSLANNNLSGEIPTSIGSLAFLQSLDLQNNSLSGVLPSSLKNCSHLKLINIGENKLSGSIPAWLGESFPFLIILSLRSNLFYGSLPVQLCHLTSLQILDLSLNNISGTMPLCFNNLSAMVQSENSGKPITYSYLPGYIENQGYVSSYIEKALVAWKGRRDEYEKSLALLRIIDLSSNSLSGRIPVEMMNLSGLVALNLSRNRLVSFIPENIGDLKQLQSLDFSRNRLSGTIPASMSDLNFLQYLDLSNNDLSGKIPSGTQLQSFDASYYSENPKLCGPPLKKKCSEDHEKTPPPPKEDKDPEDGNWLGIQWEYVSAGIGFVVGLSGVFLILILKSSWRHAYFRFWEDVMNWIYVIIIVNMNRLQWKIRS